jgi:hypothetical protein
MRLRVQEINASKPFDFFPGQTAPDRDSPSYGRTYRTPSPRLEVAFPADHSQGRILSMKGLFTLHVRWR